MAKKISKVVSFPGVDVHLTFTPGPKARPYDYDMEIAHVEKFCEACDEMKERLNDDGLCIRCARIARADHGK